MKRVLAAVALIVLVVLIISIVRYPEKYSTTWRYQLEQDVKRGDTEAAEYYQRNYLNNGIKLWD